MTKFKSYEEFNESIADIFKSAHAAIEPDQLIPIKEVIGKPKMPTQEELDAAVKYLDINPEHIYFDSKGLISPIVYWSGPVFYPFHGSLNLEALKMLRTKEAIHQHEEMAKNAIDSKNFEKLFAIMDKKIIIPAFIEMYDQIPDNKKYDVFTDLYVRSEYGFGMFPQDVIEDVFKLRKFSSDWKQRMAELEKKVNKEEKIQLYRGVNLESAAPDDVFSWTLSEKTAKFFAERFSKGSGKIIKKKVDFEDIVDYLNYRGEEEIILLPKKFQNFS
jgi:hypothetical protein